MDNEKNNFTGYCGIIVTDYHCQYTDNYRYFYYFTTVFIIAAVKKGMVTKRREDANLNFVREMKEGIAAIRGKSGIVAVIVIMTIATFCLGFVQIYYSDGIHYCFYIIRRPF